MTTFVLSFIIMALAGLCLAFGLHAGKRNVRRGCGQTAQSGLDRDSNCCCQRQQTDKRKA